MDDTRNPHPVDEFLQSPPEAAPGAERRQAVFVQTTRLLRWRRWRRRAALAGALAACYLAGILTMHLGTPSSPEPRPEVAAQPAAPVELPAVASLKTQPQPATESVLDLEWRAFEAREKRAELYRQAGDRYLEHEGDLPSALRCYGQALDASAEADLTISASDNWLLMALKEARQKEKGHARNGG